MEEKLGIFKKAYLKEKEKPSAGSLFVKRMADITKKSESTVRMWLMGRQVPDELTKIAIAKELNVRPEELF